MTQKRNPGEKIETRHLTSKFMLTVRILVGGYLLYTAYSLLEGVRTGEGGNRLLLGAFMVSFTIIGILLIVSSLKFMSEGKYVGGAMDAGEESGVGDAQAETIEERETAEENAGKMRPQEESEGEDRQGR